MNRRQLLTLSLLTLITRGKALASEEKSIPECETLKTKVKEWDIEADFDSFKLRSSFYNGRLEVWYQSSDGMINFANGEKLPDRYKNVKKGSPDPWAYDDEKYAFASLSLFVDDKLVGYKTEASSWYVKFSFNDQVLKTFKNGNNVKIECQLVPRVRVVKDPNTAIIGDKYGYELKFEYVKDATYYFNPKNFAEAYDRAGNEHEKIKQKRASGLCAASSGSGDVPCFMTTATCGAVGLDDDCFELTQLRRFRDNILVHMANGHDDIREYYEIAPLLISQLNHLELLKLYWLYIMPSSILAYLRFDRLAYRHYKRMIQGLKVRYLSVPQD